MDGAIYTVIETTRAGETVLGVFSSYAKARAALPLDDLKRLEENYRVELHLLDEPNEALLPWWVAMDRDGADLEVANASLCSCADDADLIERGSYIEDGGRRMQVLVWARTKGQAVMAVDEYRQQLIDRGAWGSEPLQLPSLRADPGT